MRKSSHERKRRFFPIFVFDVHTFLFFFQKLSRFIVAIVYILDTWHNGISLLLKSELSGVAVK